LYKIPPFTDIPMSTSAAPFVREPLKRHGHHDGADGIPDQPDMVKFLHPAYPDGSNSIMLLPALDVVESLDGKRQWGIHFATALMACAIIANNKWEGYLSGDKDGLERVDISLDEILLGRLYYFQLGSDAGWLIPYFSTTQD
jgi:hypothetical protein